MAKRRSLEEVKNIIQSFGCLLLSDYKNMTEEMTIQCKCGEIFKDTLNNILYNNYCNCEECNKIRKSEKSYNDFISQLNECNYTYESDRKDYINSKSIVDVRCNHNHIFKTSKNKINRGSKCPHCWEEGHLQQERSYRVDYDCIKERIEKNGDTLLTPKEDYKGTHYEIEIKCKNNHIFKTTYNSYEKNGCGHCGTKSKGEKEIECFLLENNILYKIHYTFDDCKFKQTLKFDFYLPQYNICIEYDGIQHFEPTDFAGKGKEWALEKFIDEKIRDTIKNIYCQQNNIKLIRIPYWNFNNIENILKQELNL